MAGPERGYALAAGLAVLAALALGQGVRGDAEPAANYRDFGGPRALWSIPDGTALPASPPARIAIPGIGVDAPTMRVGQRRNGTVEVPPFDKADRAGWYEHGPAPGTRGPSVLLGHYDDTDGAAVFYRLHTLRPGARIKVTRRDRTVAEFTVDAVETVPKWEFPRSRVYGEVRYAGLRLVTCGGPYDRSDHSYRDNVIVYAHLTGSGRVSAADARAQARP